MRKKDKEGVKKCMNMRVKGTSLRGRRTTCLKRAQNDMKVKQLKEEDCLNRNKWRAEIKKNCKG